MMFNLLIYKVQGKLSFKCAPTNQAVGSQAIKVHLVPLNNFGSNPSTLCLSCFIQTTGGFTSARKTEQIRQPFSCG